MTAVENAFSTIFWAVPAFRRVEPPITSGPTGTSTRVSTAGTAPAATRPADASPANPPAGGEPIAQVIAAVIAPASRAAARAPSTYGVRPLAVTPITTSIRPGRSALTA